MMRHESLLFASMVLGLAACAGDDTGDTDTDTDTDPAATPTYAADIQPIFDTSCVSCHTTGAASAGLDLTASANIVGVVSTQAAPMNLVEAGDPDNSYLWHKVNGTHGGAGGSGEQMPQGSELAAADLATIEAWITGGAN
jgi:mono/diheme cytochrome c family protein